MTPLKIRWTTNGTTVLLSSMNKPILDKLSKLTNGKPKAMGLGDAMAAGLHMLGVKPCKSCKNRRDALNRLFPLRRDTEARNLFK